MVSERLRIKESQERLYKKFKSEIGTGRYVPKEDTEKFRLLKESNQLLRKTLFGGTHNTWYYNMEAAIGRFDQGSS